MDDVREQVARVERLLGDVEAITDEVARSTALETVRALAGVYGEGLARIMGYIAKAGADAVRQACARDELVSHLLLLHELHPDDVVSRVSSALEGVRPALRSHGGDVELLGVEAGVVRLRLRGSCDGCASSATTLRLTVEQAIREAAPDIDRIETADDAAAGGQVQADRPGSAPAFVPLSAVGMPGGRSDRRGLIG
jgi:Fe-S cluster biogenesis protein NfuA